MILACIALVAITPHGQSQDAIVAAATQFARDLAGNQAIRIPEAGAKVFEGPPITLQTPSHGRFSFREGTLEIESYESPELLARTQALRDPNTNWSDSGATLADATSVMTKLQLEATWSHAQITQSSDERDEVFRCMKVLGSTTVRYLKRGDPEYLTLKNTCSVAFDRADGVILRFLRIDIVRPVSDVRDIGEPDARAKAMSTVRAWRHSADAEIVEVTRGFCIDDAEYDDAIDKTDWLPRAINAYSAYKFSMGDDHNSYIIIRASDGKILFDAWPAG